MRCSADINRLAASCSRSGFTLAEVLAALAFMAIVIPVAVQGIQVASRAGQMATRKSEAMRIADRVMNELEVTGMLLSGSQNGVIEEGTRAFKWRIESRSWSYGSLDEVWVTVGFNVQGREYEVRLATLVDPNVTTATEVGQ